MWICCVLKHKALSSDSCRLSLLIFAVVVAYTQRNKKIPYFCPWGLVVDICCCHLLCCCCCHCVIWCKCLGRSLWGYCHGHMIVVNPIINSWCACARWVMDSSCPALGSRIVRLRTRASLSTFLTVIAKIKRSCACAQWLIVCIALTVVVCHRWFLLSWSPLRNAIRKFHTFAHGASLSTFVVVIAFAVVVAIVWCDVNASGARSEDIVMDIWLLSIP